MKGLIMLKRSIITASLITVLSLPAPAFAWDMVDWYVDPEIDAYKLTTQQLCECIDTTDNIKDCLKAQYDMKYNIIMAERKAAEEEEKRRKTAGQTSYVAFGVLTKSGGVTSYNGHTETWYSSNARRHKDTANWTAGEDGIYRDSDGYIVVASSDLGYGATVETSHGMAKVYDSGCASGIVDVYVNWQGG